MMVEQKEPERPMPAKRAYGMDQDFYTWSPIITRPILRWPDNARVALAVIVNLEHWNWDVPASTPLALSPMGGPEGMWTGNQPQFPDIGGYGNHEYGNHEYGNRVGIFRILAVLDKYGSMPPLALDKAVADHYPTLVKEGQRRGAEFIAHGLSRRGIIHAGMSEDEERQYIRASIEAVERAAGKRPLGWSGPDFQETANTPNLLAAEGISYVCDWGNDEQPYKMTPKTGGPLLARSECLSRRQLYPPPRPAHHQRSQPAVARVVRRPLRRRCDNRAADGPASASVDHGPAVAHSASRRGARPHLRPPGRVEGDRQRDHRLVQGAVLMNWSLIEIASLRSR
jgi:peptidoglycan/xylan/chitin deacetylase (PgdA/CDA1 family)